MCGEFFKKAKETKGAAVVEAVLILVVLIALVILFKTQLTTLVRSIFKGISSNVTTILK